jgi:cytochrome c oxidase subunit 3
MKNITRSAYQAHPFHLVSPSPWPLYTCISLLSLTTSGVATMHGFNYAIYFLISSFICLILSMSFWWRDVISEGTYLGNHTSAVQRGLNMGVALFIVSEALFFLAIFWAYFHCVRCWHIFVVFRKKKRLFLKHNHNQQVREKGKPILELSILVRNFSK